MALVQTIVDQCISYDKDPWKGPVGNDGKVSHNPSANAAGASVSASSNPYDALANLLFNKHINHWRYNCKNSSEKCLICHKISRDKPHNAKKCPILKNIGLKLVKRSLAETDTSTRALNDGPPPAPPPAPVTAPPPSENSGSGTAPESFTVATDPYSYHSGDNFDYKGKLKSKVYDLGSKPSLATYL